MANVIGISQRERSHPVNICLFKVNNTNTRKKVNYVQNLTIKTPERCQWRRFGGFFVLTSNVFHTFSSVFTIDFEQVNVSLAAILKPPFDVR